MPPAAVTRRVVALLTARMAAMLVPPMRPSVSTCVYRNSSQYGSSAATASAAVTGNVVFQPLITTWPPRLSTAAITRSRPTASASVRANSRSGAPSLKSADPAMTCCAPASSTRRARSTERMPPPTRQESDLAIHCTRSRLFPVPIAASRSMTCTFGNFSNFRIHRTTCGSLMARRSPWTSCTTAWSFRSIDGISIDGGSHESTKARNENSLLRVFAFSWLWLSVSLFRRRLLLVEVRRSQGRDESRVDQAGRVALIVHLSILAELVHRGDSFVVVGRVVVVVGGLLRARVRDELVVLRAVGFLKFLHARRVDGARWIRKRRQRGAPVSERVEHALQLDDVGAFELREGAIAQSATGGVVDPLQLGDRLGVLADLDRERDVVVASSRIVRVRDLDGGRLEVAPAAVAAFRVPGFHREDHPFRQRQPGSFCRLERRRHRVDHFGADHDVRLNRVRFPLPAACPVAILLAGMGGRASLHVDQPHLT